MDKVVHFEIPADDTKRAKKFYSETFGWQIQDIPEMNYAMLTTVPMDENHKPKELGAINGGMYKREKGFSKTPVVVIGVTSLDESARKVESAGGKVVLPKVKIADMGLYAQVEDTEGNIIGLWQDLKAGTK